jgi:hypothetical protein
VRCCRACSRDGWWSRPGRQCAVADIGAVLSGQYLTTGTDLADAAIVRIAYLLLDILN